MPTTICCPPLSSLPAPLRVSLLKRPTLGASLNKTFPRLRFKSRLPSNKWRFLCDRHDNFSPDVPGSESIEDKLSEDLVTPKCDQSKDFIIDWLSSIRKGTNAVLGVEPWTVKTIVQVMVLWYTSFWVAGSRITPFLAYKAGFPLESLTYRGEALYNLLNSVADGLVAVAILHRCLAKFIPLPSDWFKVRLKGKWPFDVVLGCLMFPLVIQLSKINQYLVPIGSSLPEVFSSSQQAIVARDPVAMALFAVGFLIVSPVWEEIVFRGFLLPSLTKYMPLWCAILVSSVAFTWLHFDLQTALPHVYLSVVISVVFVRSRNLLSPMLLHSFWNAFLYLDSMKRLLR